MDLLQLLLFGEGGWFINHFSKLQRLFHLRPAVPPQLVLAAATLLVAAQLVALVAHAAPDMINIKSKMCAIA